LDFGTNIYYKLGIQFRICKKTSIISKIQLIKLLWLTVRIKAIDPIGPDKGRYWKINE